MKLPNENSQVIRFKPKKGYLLLVVMLHSTALSLLPVFLSDEPALFWIFGSIALLIVLSTTGLYKRTYYVLNVQKGILDIYYLFKVKSLNVVNIRDVVKSDSPLSGTRYALSYSDGLLLKVGKYDEYFINPKDVDGFMGAINTSMMASANVLSSD